MATRFDDLESDLPYQKIAPQVKNWKKLYVVAFVRVPVRANDEDVTVHSQIFAIATSDI